VTLAGEGIAATRALEALCLLIKEGNCAAVCAVTRWALPEAIERSLAETGRKRFH
jgi:hypothetical protein